MSQAVSSTEIPTMADVDPHKKFVCPYDKHHVISAKIYPGHVMKCRKNYSGDKYINCPFNHRHEFPLVEYDYHVANCPDKGIIEKEITSVPAPNVPAVDHHPQWDRPSPTEDWDAEADQPGFSISVTAVEDDRRDHYDELEEFHFELERQQQQQQQQLPPRDLSGLSKSQRKNIKRAQKRREKHLENGDDEDEDDGDDIGGFESQEMQPADQRFGTDTDNIDWVSILNQYCQKNKINPPQYREAPNRFGGFGMQVTVMTERYNANSVCTTKKMAKRSAARAALLGLGVAVSNPMPHKRSGGDMQRIRELEENRQLLEQRFQSNQRHVIPGLSDQQTEPRRMQPTQQQQQQLTKSEVNGGTDRLTNQMAGVKLDQAPARDEEWRVVGRKSKDIGRAPGVPNNNNPLRLAGRGRGRAR